MAVLLHRNPALASTSATDSVTVRDSAGVRLVTHYRIVTRTLVLDGRAARAALKKEQAKTTRLQEEIHLVRRLLAEATAQAAPRFWALPWFWLALLLLVLLVGTWYLRLTSRV